MPAVLFSVRTPGVEQHRSRADGSGPRPDGPGVASPRQHAVAKVGCCCGASRAVAVVERPRGCLGSALALLVTRVVADHHDPPVTADHLALVADLLDARL